VWGAFFVPILLAAVDQREAGEDCPGRKPPFVDVKRPARSYKSAIESRFTLDNRGLQWETPKALRGPGGRPGQDSA
jgi:hypothetical protein